MKKIVFITGGSSGMGKVTAKKLNQSGYTVYTGARRIEQMKDLEVEGIKTLKLDLTIDQSIVSAVDYVIEKEGRIDILINNAGYGSYGALEDVPMEEAKKQFEVNIFGLARLTQLILPYMRKQNYGKIVNISSIGGKTYTPMGSWYYSSKFALEGLSDSLRLEVKDFGIDVIIIEPGAIKTEWQGITAENLLKVSGDTAYSEMAQLMSDVFTTSINPSEPDVIAKTIYKAITSKNPKTRYAVGSGARMTLTLRKVLSDKMYDRVTMASLKMLGKNNQEVAEILTLKNNRY